MRYFGRIQTREELRALATELGVRPDWHEPDEQNVTVKVLGKSFDNAGFWPLDKPGGFPRSITEMYAEISVEGVPVAQVNLATLFSWAAEPSAPR